MQERSFLKDFSSLQGDSITDTDATGDATVDATADATVDATADAQSI